MRKSREPSELVGASKHLFYEISMLCLSMKAELQTRDLVSAPIKNALVESFAIHLRNIIEFLYARDMKNEPHSDSVIADDYFSDFAYWKSQRNEISAILIEYKNRAHKQIAHLTYERVKTCGDKWQWNYNQIVQELKTTLCCFIDRVPENLVISDLKNVRLVEELRDSPFWIN